MIRQTSNRGPYLEPTDPVGGVWSMRSGRRRGMPLWARFFGKHRRTKTTKARRPGGTGQAVVFVDEFNQSMTGWAIGTLQTEDTETLEGLGHARQLIKIEWDILKSWYVSDFIQPYLLAMLRHEKITEAALRHEVDERTHAEGGNNNDPI